MDLGDSVYDSAVFLDNFRWTVDPSESCQSGAVGIDDDEDGIPNYIDNCPLVANPSQVNSVHPGTPEGDHCDDPDVDTVFDITDNCPDTPNAGQDNADGDAWGDACETADCVNVATTWITPPGDADCDGWTTDREVYLGTNANDPCAATGWATGEDAAGVDDEGPPDAWPLDFNDDQVANLADVVNAFVTMLSPGGLDQPATGPLVRVDFVDDGWIDLQDVTLGFIIKLLPTGLDTACTP